MLKPNRNKSIYLQFALRELNYASLKRLLTLISCFLRVSAEFMSANLIPSCQKKFWEKNVIF